MIDFRFYLVTNRSLCKDKSLDDVVREACAAGIRAVQLREKDLTGRELYELAARLRAISKQSNTKLFINDRVDIVLAVDADGVHCPERGIPIAAARKLTGGKLIGVSVHSVEKAIEAEREGADFIAFGPIYSTPSKKGYGPPRGLDALAEVIARVRIPVFAIGGITPERVSDCLKQGARGVAVVSAVMGSSNVPNVVSEFKNTLGAL